MSLRICCCLPVIFAANIAVGSGVAADKDMVYVKGGAFLMGDVFGEGNENERPTHQVTLSDFYIAKYEITVGQFREFVQETGYKTSAEGSDNLEEREKILKRFSSDGLSEEELTDLHAQFLKYSGTGYWDAEECRWSGYNPHCDWRNPGFEQSDTHPVVGVSPDDAMHYCNWLSKKAGLPASYNLQTGEMLDPDGNPTSDITQVRGYRLPTEAEWEYAAREGGREARFGNGKSLAKSSEINFRAAGSEYEYQEKGGYRKGTVPVGSYRPNALDLYDMSGNAWEWAGDKFAEYGSEAQRNPCATTGNSHALRGGRWGGDAFEARVFHRSSWVRNDRCNNSGFRIAKTDKP
jgi:formylglycine-generating enzyme required for sulfatase activity